MKPSSRTPEGQPKHCPVCGKDLKIEPSHPPGDAPCPHCGHLLWFQYMEDSRSPAKRERVQHSFEHARKQMAQENHDYAAELLKQCVLRVSPPRPHSGPHCQSPAHSGIPTPSPLCCPISLARPENATLPASVLIQSRTVSNNPRRGERPTLRGSVQRRSIPHRSATRDKALFVIWMSGEADGR